MLSATASLGLLLLWDVDGGLTQIDKYLYSSEEYIKAGALLACGIVNTGVRNECDPALALLSDYVLHTSNVMRIGAILGNWNLPIINLLFRFAFLSRYSHLETPTNLIVLAWDDRRMIAWRDVIYS